MAGLSKLNPPHENMGVLLICFHCPVICFLIPEQLQPVPKKNLTLSFRRGRFLLIVRSAYFLSLTASSFLSQVPPSSFSFPCRFFFLDPSHRMYHKKELSFLLPSVRAPIPSVGSPTLLSSVPRPAFLFILATKEYSTYPAVFFFFL